MPDEQVAFINVSDLLRHLHNFGYEQEQLLTKAGLTESALRNYELSGVIPAHVFSNLYYSAVSLLPEEIRQSFWAGGFAGKTFRLAAYAIITARTCRQALQRLHDLHERIDSSHPHIAISSRADIVRFTYTPAQLAGTVRRETGADRVVALAITSALTAWHNFLSWMVGQRIELERVVFGDPVQQDRDHEGIKRLLKFSDIEYLPGNSFMEFSTRYLDLPIVATSETLDRYLDYFPSEPMSTVASSDTIVEKIQALIGKDYSNGFPSFDQLADRLAVSTSSLRRKLLAEKSSYQAIKDEARKELAIELLCNSELSITDIAERTGFVNQGSFSRFFREWTKMSPQQYREQHRHSSDN